MTTHRILHGGPRVGSRGDLVVAAAGVACGG